LSENICITFALHREGLRLLAYETNRRPKLQN